MAIARAGKWIASHRLRCLAIVSEGLTLGRRRNSTSITAAGITLPIMLARRSATGSARPASRMRVATSRTSASPETGASPPPARP